MQYKFSKELRERIKRYFKKYHSLIISDETAEEFLDSLADLYQTFSA